MAKLEVMQDKVAALNRFLQSPEPGLFTWHQYLHGMMHDLIDCYNEEGAYAEQPKEEVR